MSQGDTYGVPASALVALTGAHLATARRWKRAACVPRWLARLIAVCWRGELAEISPAWAGWRLVGGALVSPEGWEATPGDVRSLPFLRQQIAMYQSEARLPAQSDWVSGSYRRLPGALVSDAAPRALAEVVSLARRSAQDDERAERDQREHARHA